MPGGWEGSRWTPPPGWSQIVKAVAARSGGLCEVIRDSTGRRCNRPADGGVDHIRPVHQGGSDELDNLQHSCRWHHRAKSSAEGNAAREVNRQAGKLPTEGHPGMRRGRPR